MKATRKRLLFLGYLALALWSYFDHLAHTTKEKARADRPEFALAPSKECPAGFTPNLPDVIAREVCKAASRIH